MPAVDPLADQQLPSADAPRPDNPRWFAPAVAVVALVALVVRVTFVLLRQSRVRLTTGDAYWYHWQAHLVATGRGFLNPFEFYKNGVAVPGADHPPGMVLLLAAAEKLGLGSPQSQRLLMTVIGTASVVLIAMVARRVAGPRAGVIAAAIAALYPNIWINDGMLMAETPFVLGVAGALLFAYRTIDGPDRLNVLGLTSSLTLAALTRPESVLLFPFFVVPLLLARRQVSMGERLRYLVIAAIVPLMVFAPWVAYNMGRFEKPVLISTGAGQTLAVGNCKLTYGGTMLGFYHLGCITTEITAPTDPDASVRDPKFQKVALEYMSSHRGELPKVVAARVGRMWHLYRVGQSVKLDGFVEGRSGGPPGTGGELVWAALWSYYALLPLALGGAVVLRRQRVNVYPLLAHAALATFVAASTFGVTRYRVGADVAFTILAAVALDAVVRRWWLRPESEPVLTRG